MPGSKPRLTPEQRAKRAEELREYRRNYRAQNRQQLTAKKKQYAENAKQEGIAHYGGACQCCGESEYLFLTLEHIKGRDKTKKRRTGKVAWLELKWQGWPEGHTVLCFNCNCAKGAFGVCPHQKTK